MKSDSENIDELIASGVFETTMTREEDQLYLRNTYKRKMNEAIADKKKTDALFKEQLKRLDEEIKKKDDQLKEIDDEIEKKDMLIQFLVPKAVANGTSKEEIQHILGMSKEELEKML